MLYVLVQHIVHLVQVVIMNSLISVLILAQIIKYQMVQNVIYVLLIVQHVTYKQDYVQYVMQVCINLKDIVFKFVHSLM